jgi:hypothetical protein
LMTLSLVYLLLGKKVLDFWCLVLSWDIKSLVLALVVSEKGAKLICPFMSCLSYPTAYLYFNTRSYPLPSCTCFCLVFAVTHPDPLSYRSMNIDARYLTTWI